MITYLLNQVFHACFHLLLRIDLLRGVITEVDFNHWHQVHHLQGWFS